MKVCKLFYDLETTGLDPALHSIHEIAYSIEIDDAVVCSRVLHVKPFASDQIVDAALLVGKVTRKMLEDYMPPLEAFNILVKDLEKHINRYSRAEKFYLVGFNNNAFDDPFLRKFFEKCGNEYFSAYFWSASLDAMVLAGDFMIDVRPGMQSFKLFRVAMQLGIDVDPDRLHGAEYDLHLTRSIYRKVTGREEDFY